MGGRPAKSINLISKNLTPLEREIRTKAEEKLRGSKKIHPPTYLSADQKKIFRFIVKELEEANILGSLDVYVLASTAISISRLQALERKINEDPGYMFDRDLLQARDRYTKDFFRGCSELCLSPQARAKIGTLNVKSAQEDEDPLLKALKEDD